MREPEQKRDQKRRREIGKEPEREGATQSRRREGEASGVKRIEAQCRHI